MIMLLGLLAMLGPLTWALEVRPETGALSYSMIDLVSQGGGKSLYYRRFYNTAATQVGWFGRSSGSTFETSVRIEPDGTLTLLEYGQTPGTVFFPTKKPVRTKEVIATILNFHQDFKGPGANSLKKKLEDDRNFFLRYATQLNQMTTPEVGETYKTTLFGGQEIVFKNGGFVRDLNNGTTEYFNSSGRLTQIHRKDFDQKITLTYDGSGQLTEVTDNALNALRFFWREDGLVDKIANLRSGKMVKCAYDGNSLTSIELEDGATYQMSYNKSGLLATYKNKNGITEISYDGKLNTPIQIRNPDGSIEHWNFQTKSSADTEIRTVKKEVLRKDIPIKKESWITTLKKNSQGKFPLTMSHIFEGRETKTKYRSCCYPQPENIATPEGMTSFSYDLENRLILKKSQHLPALEVFYDGEGRISLIRSEDRQIKYIYGSGGIDPDQFLGHDFLLQHLKSSKSKDSFSVKWKGENREHTLEYVRSKNGLEKTILYDGKEIVKFVENVTEGSTVFYRGDETRSKELLARIDKMMSDVDLRIQVNYRE